MGDILVNYDGTNKEFKLGDKKLLIPARLDTHFYYRLVFKELAISCTKKACDEYRNLVTDLPSFYEHFPTIYQENLNTIINKAIDVLIANEIYNYSAETFSNIHQDIFHLVADGLNELEEQKNTLLGITTNALNGITNVASSLFAKDSAFLSSFIGGIGEGFTENLELSPEQCAIVYGNITVHILFNRIYSDYWNVYLTLLSFLQVSGKKDIWMPDETPTAEVENIYKNLSNPNLSNDKAVELLFDLIIKSPFKKELYDFMREKFGETDEVLAILEYFDYSNLEKILFTEEDFPKKEVEIVSVDSNPTVQTENEETVANDESTNGNVDNSFSFDNIVNKAKTFTKNLDKDKIKKGVTVGAGILGAGVIGAAALFGGSGKSSKGTRNESRYKDLLGSNGCARNKNKPCAPGFCPLYENCSRGRGGMR